MSFELRVLSFELKNIVDSCFPKRALRFAPCRRNDRDKKSFE